MGEQLRSIIINLTKGSFFDFTERYLVAYVDSHEVRYGFNMSWINISPGWHEIIVNFTYSNEKIEKCSCFSNITLNVKIEPNTEYELKGRVVGEKVEVWIEEKISGEIVSNVVDEVYRGRYERIQ